MTIRILIADDHNLFRQGLTGLLGTREDLTRVVGHAATGQEAVELAGALRPDIVLLDLYMPDGDGLFALRCIKERFPEVQVVMLTSSESDDHLFQAIQLGAAGYLLKSLDASQLFDLLEGVVRGEVAVTRETGLRLLKRLAKPRPAAGGNLETLTDREIAVLRLVATGASNQEIADSLVVSINTVKSHIRSILDKLQLDNRTQAANYAIQRGLVPPLS